MAELHTFHSEEERSQAGSLEQDEHRRLREEIQQQIEAERAASVGQEQQQQQQTRRKAAIVTSVRETARTGQTVKSPIRKRAYGMDALLLCALTMGVGMFLGPSMQGLGAHAPYRSASPYGVPPALASGAWTFQDAVDQRGNDWAGSQMNITEDTALPNGEHQVSGSFNWQADGNFVGTEEFSGTYDPNTRALEVEGGAISQADPAAPVHLVDGKYTMHIGPDGKSVTDGYMEGIPGGTPAVPGSFGAVQQP